MTMIETRTIGFLTACTCFAASLFGQSTAADYLRRGSAAADRGEVESALADFGRAIEMDPNDGHIFLARGLAE